MITDIQLLEVPLENTLSQLTQAIRFLAANDFLQGVEAYAGEADERERDRNKITVVGENETLAAEEPAKVTEVTEAPQEEQAPVAAAEATATMGDEGEETPNTA